MFKTFISSNIIKKRVLLCALCASIAIISAGCGSTSDTKDVSEKETQQSSEVTPGMQDNADGSQTLTINVNGVPMKITTQGTPDSMANLFGDAK